MSTQQPEWEFVANLGDVNAADYGAFLVYRDKTGVYDPEVELYETDETGNGGTVYRFMLEPPRFKTNGAYHVETGEHEKVWCNEWFVEKLPEVAKSCGQSSHLYLLRGLLSKDPIRRASAYQDIVGYFGAFEFDQYPLQLTEDEAQKRYADIPRLTRLARERAS